MIQVKTSFLTKHQLPLVIEPTKEGACCDDLLDFIYNNLDWLKKELLTYGGLLFRGFGTDQVQNFSQVIDALGLGTSLDYIGGGSPRSKVYKSIYTSTEAAPDIKICLHNELSYSNIFPKHIYFWCDIPPQEGGETFLGDARKIFEKVNPSLKQKFQEKQLNYISRYYCQSKLMELVNKIKRGHRSWKDVFETDNKQDVEEKCKKAGINLKWNQNDWLEISRMRPAFLEHPETKETVWFNQVHLFDYNPRFIGMWKYVAMRLFYIRKHMQVDEVHYADKSKIARKDIYHIHDILDEESIYFPWQNGDVLVLDNILAMHGRAPFKGKRRILTAMTS